MYALFVLERPAVVALKVSGITFEFRNMFVEFK